MTTKQRLAIGAVTVLFAGLFGIEPVKPHQSVIAKDTMQSIGSTLPESYLITVPKGSIIAVEMEEKSIETIHRQNALIQDLSKIINDNSTAFTIGSVKSNESHPVSMETTLDDIDYILNFLEASQVSKVKPEIKRYLKDNPKYDGQVYDGPDGYGNRVTIYRFRMSQLTYHYSIFWRD